jgi:hypothetical protein
VLDIAPPFREEWDFQEQQRLFPCHLVVCSLGQELELGHKRTGFLTSMLALVRPRLYENIDLEPTRKAAKQSYANSKTLEYLFSLTSAEALHVLPIRVDIPQWGTVGVNSTFI